MGWYALDKSLDIWGRDKGPFHFKDDWDGDNLVQTDEASHLFIAYKMAQAASFLFKWDGFSDKWANILGSGVSFAWLFIVEYPLDSYNPYQGFGVSDFMFNIAGLTFAYLRATYPSLKKFDLRISNKHNPLKLKRIIAWTLDEYDSWIYWLSYTPNPRKIPLSIAIGYSSWRKRRDEPRREWHIALTISPYELYSFLRGTENRMDFWGIYQFPVAEHIILK